MRSKLILETLQTHISISNLDKKNHIQRHLNQLFIVAYDRTE